MSQSLSSRVENSGKSEVSDGGNLSKSKLAGVLPDKGTHWLLSSMPWRIGFAARHCIHRLRVN